MIKMAVSKETLEYRKSNNLCSRCGQPNEDGKRMCSKHLRQAADRRNKQRKTRIAAGQCAY
jgi:predicted nucleic acid-binding Zn ribbon protein